MTDEYSTGESQKKSHAAGVLMSLIVLAMMGVANLPYKYTELEGKWSGLLDVSLSVYSGHQTMPTMAGWPLRYLIEYEPEENLVQRRYWAPMNLAVNASLAILASAFVYAFLWLRQQDRGKDHRASRRILWDVTIAVAILAVPISIVGHQYAQARAHRQLSQRMLRYGNSYVSCWLPEVFVDYVPKGWLPSFRRLREVHMIGGSTEFVRSVLEVPTMVMFNSLRGDWDLSALEALEENPYFSSLQINERSLSAGDFGRISRMRWLAQLHLAKTSFDAADLRRLDQLRLRAVNLSQTSMKLSELGRPGWSSVVESLHLSRPIDGSASLRIDGWPRLRELSVTRFMLRTNADPLDIRLTDLPQLEVLRLNRFQKHRLVLRRLPRLAVVDEGLNDRRFVNAFRDFVPGLSWVSDLELDGLDSMTSVELFARDLESLSIRNSPNIRRIALGSFLWTPYGGSDPQPADRQRCQEWIRQLGDRSGPGTIDLTGLPLADVDLTPLAQNDRVRHLHLGGTGVSFDQVKCLRGMSQIETLDLRSCELVDQQLEWLLTAFPKMKDLTIDASRLRRVEWNDRLQLKQVRMTPLDAVDRFSIVDLPSLSTRVRILGSPEQIRIRNASSLTGLAVHGSWPEDAELTGLRDLRWFAGGGPRLGDDVVDTLLRCRELDELTLAYTSVSREQLKRLGQLRALTMLAVPGGHIDDDVTADWRQLGLLWEVNLDDTRVSAATLAWLSRIGSLRRVSLSRVPLDDAGLDALSELRQISELSIAGVPIDSARVKQLLLAGNLESINLAGIGVDDALIDAIGESTSVETPRVGPRRSESRLAFHDLVREPGPLCRSRADTRIRQR